MLCIIVNNLEIDQILHLFDIRNLSVDYVIQTHFFGPDKLTYSHDSSTNKLAKNA